MKFLVLILLFVLLCKVDHITSTNTHDDRNPGLLFDNHPGYLLSLPANMTKVKQMTTKAVSSKMDCVFACVGTSWCRSVNFKITAEMDGRHICEVIATDNYTNPKYYLKQDKEITHLNIKNPCEDEPCLNQGICIPHSNRLDYRCKCKEGYTGSNCQNEIGIRDCSDLYKNGERRNGVYTIKPDSQGTFHVYCDMTTDGGGWTAFQRRQDGSVDFYLDWQPYKTGFGNLSGEFWLGNAYIHRLTARTLSTLRVDMEDWAGTRKYAKYGNFSVNGESDNYRLNVGSYSGTAGDSLSYHNNMAFSTKDRDNDPKGSENCATSYTGAWWYHGCYSSNLNGRYLGNVINTKGVRWYNLPMKFTEMKIRDEIF